MPYLGKKSRAHLDTTHHDIIAVCNELILITDFSVIWGRRPPKIQFNLFKKGRTLKRGRWVITDKSKIVTYKDGYKKLSRHNVPAPEESTAVDLAPYPIRWKDIGRFRFLAGGFLGIAHRLRMEGIIESQFQWGGNWRSFKDWPHFQIKRS